MASAGSVQARMCSTSFSAAEHVVGLVLTHARCPRHPRADVPDHLDLRLPLGDVLDALDELSDAVLLTGRVEEAHHDAPRSPIVHPGATARTCPADHVRRRPSQSAKQLRTGRDGGLDGPLGVLRCRRGNGLKQDAPDGAPAPAARDRTDPFKLQLVDLGGEILGVVLRETQGRCYLAKLSDKRPQSDRTRALVEG